MALSCTWAIEYERLLSGLGAAARFHEEQVRGLEIVDRLVSKAPAGGICWYSTTVGQHRVVAKDRWLVLHQSEHRSKVRACCDSECERHEKCTSFDKTLDVNIVTAQYPRGYPCDQSKEGES